LIATEERAALRVFLRALRSLPQDLPWHATVWTGRPTAPPATLGKLLRDRVSFRRRARLHPGTSPRPCDIAVLASEGDRAMPGTLVHALGAGAVVVASRLPAYEEVLAEGEHGLMFEPGEVQTLAAHLTALVSDTKLLQRSAAQVRKLGSTFSWERVAGELEEVYLELAARRRDPAEIPACVHGSLGGG